MDQKLQLGQLGLALALMAKFAWKFLFLQPFFKRRSTTEKHSFFGQFRIGEIHGNWVPTKSSESFSLCGETSKSREDESKIVQIPEKGH